MAVSVAPVVPTAGKLNGYNVAHLTGTTAFQFTPEQRQEVMRFIAAGGTLVVDAAGGSTEFADAAEKELAAMYGGKPNELGQLLDPTDRLYNLKGVKIDSVDYRPYMRRRATGKLMRRGSAASGCRIAWRSSTAARTSAPAWSANPSTGSPATPLRAPPRSCATSSCTPPGAK